MDMLGQHPQVNSLSEVLIPQNLFVSRGDQASLPTWYVYLSAKQASGQAGDITSWLFGYLDTLREYHHHQQSVGFIAMYDRFKVYPQLLDYLVSRNIGVIHLTRRNHLNAVVSEAVAKQSDVWHLAHDRNLQITPVKVHTRGIVERLTSRMNSVGWWSSYLAQAGLPYIEMIYEELLRNPCKFDEAISFLGLNRGSFNSPSMWKKAISRPLSEIIENYSELREKLQGSKFEDLMESADTDNGVVRA